MTLSLANWLTAGISLIFVLGLIVLLARLLRAPELRWTAEAPDDWREPFPDWPGTRYEAKALREGKSQQEARAAAEAEALAGIFENTF